jgi:hypothetical protein
LGTDAEKMTVSVTGKTSRLGALTLGGAVAHDNGLIPMRESFLDYDNGWKIPASNVVRGIEIVSGPHWYWYSTARILSIHGMTIFYLPRAWTWSLGMTGAQSDFFANGTQWRPSGMTKIGFPLAGSEDHHLDGNLFFAVGTENFAQADQIGHFSSQTYGGGLRLRLTSRQDVTGNAAYQKRTQDRSQTSFGLSYGLHF